MTRGPRKGLLQVSIVPVCPTCTRRSHEDPSYLNEMLDRFSRSRLRVIEGAGESDGIPVGQLHLVEAPIDE